MDTIAVEEIRKVLDEIERSIDHSKKLSTQFHNADNKTMAVYCNGEANGLELAYRKIVRLIEK